MYDLFLNPDPLFIRDHVLFRVQIMKVCFVKKNASPKQHIINNTFLLLEKVSLDVSPYHPTDCCANYSVKGN